MNSHTDSSEKDSDKATETESPDFDVLIAGGGLVGASLAIALAPSGLKIAVVEAIPFDSAQQPSYDERTIALTYSSKLIFEQLGIWNTDVTQEACAIEKIHISNRGHFGITHLTKDDAGTPALGYVVPTRSLGQSLSKRLSSFDNIELICPGVVQSARPQDVLNGQPNTHCLIKVEQAKEIKEYTSRLLVIADGGRSPLLTQQGFKIDQKPYPQSALLSIVSADRPHQYQAFERFTSSGPLALLPMTQQRYAVVWTLHPDELANIKTLDDSQFITELQHAFGYRAGRFSAPTARKSYPLSLDILQKTVEGQTVVVGNAAHKVHPVAGQGFNLGLRDAAALAELITDAHFSSKNIASSQLLSRYQAWRAKETEHVTRFTDGMINVFSSKFAPLMLGRNIGLSMVEHLPMAKRFLLRRTMGMAAHQPKLALGQKLSNEYLNK